MAFPPRFLDEIRARVSLSDVVGRRIKLIRAGREYKACCPFHHEKTPSFYVNDEKQFYHCFGCGAHGDVIRFITDHDNVPFRETVEMLAAEAGLDMPKEDPRAVQRAQKAKDLHEMMSEAAQWFMHQLHAQNNREVLTYAQDRGLSGAAAADFMIGYAPADGKALRTYLEGKGYAIKDMIEAGLFKPSRKGGEPYAFFRDRVIFPVADRRGRIVAFGGRILPEHIRPIDPNSSFKPPKYLNSSDTVLFDKSHTLYGADKARIAARNNKPLIVTEGYMDVIACHAAGFNGAVAPMGTALTEGQIQALWAMQMAEEKLPILCFDGDNAGRRAASRAVERPAFAKSRRLCQARLHARWSRPG